MNTALIVVAGASFGKLTLYRQVQELPWVGSRICQVGRRITTPFIYISTRRGWCCQTWSSMLFIVSRHFY